MKLGKKLKLLSLLSGFFLCAVFIFGSNFAIDQTSTNEFCFSCHEMRDNLQATYENSSHYKNASGVKALCRDCHIPEAIVAKLQRKFFAINDVYHGIVGTIDTPEKYAAKHLELAERVWADMAANNSQTCRKCHSYEAMNFEIQSRRGAEKMQHAQKKNQPCTECHKGMVHKLPADYDPDD